MMNHSNTTLFSLLCAGLTLSACGSDSQPCTITDNGDGSSTVSCPDGTSVDIAADTSCTITDGDDGAKVVTCGDGTTATIVPDTSCAIADNGDGTKTVTCADGSSATIAPDTDTACTIADVNGAKTVTCADGSSATITPPTTMSVRGTIAPGGELVLPHGLASAQVTAAYVEEGRVRDISEFIGLHSPVVGEPITNFSSRRLSSHHGEVLSNGDYLLYGNGEFAIFKPDGTEVVPWTTPDVSQTFLCHLKAEALEGGGFLLIYDPDCFGATATVQRFDNTGSPENFPGGSTASVTLGGVAFSNVNANSVCARPDGSFTTVTSAIEVATGDRVRLMAWYGADGSEVLAASTMPDPTSNGYIQVECLGNGNVAVIHEDELGAEEDEATVLTVHDPTNAVVASYTINGSYIGDTISSATAPNGNFIVATEIGGPDALMYAVFDPTGALIGGPTTLSGHEPDYFTAGVYPDGDFVIGAVEDDSGVGMMWNVRNDGRPEHTMPIFFGDGFEPDNRFAIFPGSNSNEVVMTYDVYNNPDSYMVTVSKNYLSLTETAEGEATVTNYSHDTVEVVLSAVGSPP